MKKVFLRAYDKQNLGDDLFVHIITARYPHVRFFLRSDEENRKTFACLPNLRILQYQPLPARLLEKLRPSLAVRYLQWQEKRCDATVYIGGSIFIEYPQWRQFTESWAYQAKTFRYYILGANFGPYHDPDYPLVMAEIFSQMQDICFRDRYSYNLFSQISTVRLAPDILFSYPMPKARVKEKQVFVSVINCAARDDSHGLRRCHERYVRNMAALLEGYLANGCSVILGSFCKAEGDEEGIAAIRGAMSCPDHPNLHTLCYDGTNAHAMTHAMAASEYVIATRFHATVLAMAAGRPVLPILYSDKTKHLLDDLDFSGVCFDLRQDENWDYLRSRLNWDQPQKALSDEIRQAAQAHFEKLDQRLLSQ